MRTRRVVAGGLVLVLAALPAQAQERAVSPVPARVRAELAVPVSALRTSIDRGARAGDVQAPAPGGNQRLRMAGPNTAGVVVAVVALAAATIVLMLALRSAGGSS